MSTANKLFPAERLGYRASNAERRLLHKSSLVRKLLSSYHDADGSLTQVLRRLFLSKDVVVAVVVVVVVSDYKVRFEKISLCAELTPKSSRKMQRKPNPHVRRPAVSSCVLLLLRDYKV